MGERYLIGGDQPRYKIILVGDVNVGKTAMFWRFTEGQFLATKDTMVTTIDFKMKRLLIENYIPVKLYVWDTAGSEKYRSIVSTYFKGCHGVIIVFDLSHANSFTNAIEQWYEIAKNKTPNSVYLLVGNKSDLPPQVNSEDVLKWSYEHKIPYIQTSVKEDINISKVFESITNRIFRGEQKFQKSQSFSLKNNRKNQKNMQGKDQRKDQRKDYRKVERKASKCC